MAIDFDEVEETGDLARRAILAEAERAGLDVTAAGRLLATLSQSHDERVAARALDRFFDLGAIIPNRRRSVRVETDQRAISATHGRGELAGGIDDAELNRLPPEQRREAIAALETLARIRKGSQDGARTDANRPIVDRGDLHQRDDEHHADVNALPHPHE